MFNYMQLVLGRFISTARTQDFFVSRRKANDHNEVGTQCLTTTEHRAKYSPQLLPCQYRTTLELYLARCIAAVRHCMPRKGKGKAKDHSDADSGLYMWTRASVRKCFFKKLQLGLAVLEVCGDGAGGCFGVLLSWRWPLFRLHCKISAHIKLPWAQNNSGV